jgi:hypothetical protein
MEETCQLHDQVVFYKFADDGSAKVTGRDLEECLYYMNIVLGSITEWTSKWRMVVNCDVNKTEYICFYTNTPELVPTSFALGNKNIYLTDHSKVLGVILDKKLNFKEHSQGVFNKLVYRWVCLCRYSNRNWGLNQRVMTRIVKAIIFSSLFYASMVWMRNTNMSAINSLWYKISKSAVGPVFNVHSSLLEIILGVPPLEITNRMITIKHYLKAISEQPTEFTDPHITFLCEELKSQNTAVTCHIRDVLKFLEWKLEHYPLQFTPMDTSIITGKELDLFPRLSRGSCFYSKVMVKLFTECVWQDSLNTKLLLDGWSNIPKVSTDPLKIPFSASRDDEVKFMSFFYKNNLLNSFVFRIERTICPSPLCICLEEEQTGFHLLASCSLVDVDVREQLIHRMMLCNLVKHEEELVHDPVTIINSSRDPEFVALCLEVVRTQDLQLRSKITLSKKGKSSQTETEDG